MQPHHHSTRPVPNTTPHRPIGNHHLGGPLDVSYCDAWSTFGHPIELRNAVPEFEALANAVAAAAKHYDGKDPLHELPH